MVGLTGSGNSNQFAGLVSNIVNPQGTFGGVNQARTRRGPTMPIGTATTARTM